VSDESNGLQPPDLGPDRPQVIHSQKARISGSEAFLSPETADLSTTDDGTSSTVADLASDALRAARAIAGGLPAPSARFRRRRRSPDSRDPMSIGAIVGQSIPELGWTAPLSEARLFGQWASLVGTDIADRCQPVSLRNGELRIAAESTAWATQLRLLAPQLLKRICAELPPGTVSRLQITGPSAPSWKHGPWSMRGGRGVRDTYG
jgi:predicted nucleic acid-binding Zn ribbon protein